MSDRPSFGVIGGGSWATAIVKLLSAQVEQIHWYMRNPTAIEKLESVGHNPNYLSAVEFAPNQLALSTDINKVIRAADYLIFAIPSAFLHKELEKVQVDLKNKVVFSAIKGIVPERGLIVGEHLHRTFDIPYENIGVISGPCHAEEVALERLSFLTIASFTEEHSAILARFLDNSFIQCNLSGDVVGIEYAGMLKNIYALAAGIAHGLGYGDNFQSVLISNAIREMKRYIKDTYQIKRDINNSVYLGDLLVTSYSAFSRNRMFGTMIGKGYTVDSAQLEMNMIAEGYYATKGAFQLKNDRENMVETPIIDTVYDILYHNENPREYFKDLTRKLD